MTGSALARATILAAVALASAALVVVDPVRGAGASVVRAAEAAWHDVFADRPEPAFAQRMIVVLSAPSLADRIAASEEPASPEQQKRWVAEADASQRVLLERLRRRGVVLRPEETFTRTLN